MAFDILAAIPPSVVIRLEFAEDQCSAWPFATETDPIADFTCSLS